MTDHDGHPCSPAAPAYPHSYSLLGDNNEDDDKEEDSGDQPAVDIDIYGSLDEDISRIQEQQRQRQLCHLDNNATSDDDDNVEMVLFSYFCDHFT